MLNNVTGSGFTEPVLYPSPETIKQQTCWIEIDRAKFLSNLFWLKKLIGPSVKVAAVLKSNAYGHGTENMAALCEQAPDIAYLTTFLLSDALKIRAMGVKKPVAALCGYDAPIAEGIKNNIDLVVHDWETAHEISARAHELKKTAQVQIKIDTGLLRLGFTPDELAPVIDYLTQNPFISIVGAYTHFAESDSMDTTFTQLQMDRFKGAIDYLRNDRGLALPYIHMANSAGTLRFEGARWNTVRCGGILYGSYKDERFYQQAAQIVPGFTLSTILTLKGRVLAIKDVPVGTPVGYARSFVTQKPMRLAMVSVGYYDGFDRRLSNKGHLYMHNTLVPIVGRVGMNMTTVDITNLSQVRIGDEAIFMGAHEGVRLKNIAQTMGVIEYEVMPPLNPNIPRFIV